MDLKLSKTFLEILGIYLVGNVFRYYTVLGNCNIILILYVILFINVVVLLVYVPQKRKFYVPLMVL